MTRTGAFLTFVSFCFCCCRACRSKVTEACRAAVLACVERSTNSEGRIVEVNAFADFFSKAMSEFTSFEMRTGVG